MTQSSDSFDQDEERVTAINRPVYVSNYRRLYFPRAGVTTEAVGCIVLSAMNNRCQNFAWPSHWPSVADAVRAYLRLNATFLTAARIEELADTLTSHATLLDEDFILS